MEEKHNRKVVIISIITIIVLLLILLFIFWPRKAIVTLNLENVREVSVLKGNVMEEPEPPKKEGYTFIGWYVGDEKFDFDTEIKEDITLTPKWTANNYTIKFKNGSKTIEVEGKYGETVELPEAPKKTGYYFVGWFNGEEEFTSESILEEDMEVEAHWADHKVSYRVEHYLMTRNKDYNSTPDYVTNKNGLFGKSVSPDVNTYKGYISPIKQTVILDDGENVIKYYYELGEYTLKLSYDNGFKEVNGEGTYYYGDKVNITYLLKDGYSFKDYSEKTDGNVYTMPDKDITINLSSSPNKNTKYQVKHLLMQLDGTYTVEDVEDLQGTTDTKVTPNVKQYKGFTSPSEITVNVNGDGSTIVEYSYTRNKYILSLKGDNGIKALSGEGTYYYGEEVNVSATLNNGYTFDKWSNGEKELTFTYTMDADDTTLEASTKVNTYSITYTTDGNMPSEYPIEYTVEQDVLLPIPTKDGYEFKGWVIDGTEDIIKTITKGTYFENLNLTASFEALDMPYIIKYYYMDVEGQYGDAEYTDSYNGKTDSPVTTDRRETPEEFEEPVLKVNGEKVNLEDITVSGKGDLVLEYYYERKSFPVNVELSGLVSQMILTLNGEEYNAEMKVYNGAEVKLEATIKDSNLPVHFTLSDNWVLSEDGLKATFTQIMPLSEINTSISLDLNTYTVIFDGNNGTVDGIEDGETTYTQEVRVSITDEYPRLMANKFEYEGYDFMGWSTDPDKAPLYSKDYFNDDGTYTLNNNLRKANGDTITLYAVWQAHKNTVTFKMNDGTGRNHTSLRNQEYDQPLSSKPKDPSRTGYGFDGWFKDSKGEEQWDFENDKMPDGSLTLYAKWNPNHYTVAFDANGGEGSLDSVTFTYDGSDNKLPMHDGTSTFSLLRSSGEGIYRDYYDFLGWNTNKTAEEAIYNDGVVVKDNLTAEENGNVTLYAIWDLTEYNLTYTIEDEKVTCDGCDNRTYNYEDEIELPMPTKVGYTFTGWKKNNSGEEIFKIEKHTNGDINLTPTFRPNKYYIKYNGNGNTSGEMSSLTECTYDQECTLSNNAFEKKYTIKYMSDGSEFKSQDVIYAHQGWSYNGQTYTDKVLNLTTEDLDQTKPLKLDAIWESDKKVNLISDIPTKQGYNFLGWKLKDSTDSKLLTDEDLTDLNENIIIDAVWKEKEISITYNANNGTDNSITESLKYTASDYYKQHNFKNTYTINYVYDSENTEKVTHNATFQCWSNTENGSCYDLTEVKKLMDNNTTNLTLYAIWNEYTTSLDSSKTSQYATKLSDEISTYSFKSWVNGTKEVSNITLKNSNNNVTLTIKWNMVVDTDAIVKKYFTKNTTDLVSKEGSTNYDTNNIVVDIKNVNYSVNSLVSVINSLSTEIANRNEISKITITYNDGEHTNNIEIDKNQNDLTNLFTTLTDTAVIYSPDGTVTQKAYSDRKISSLYNKKITIQFALNNNEKVNASFKSSEAGKYNISFTSDYVTSKTEFNNLLNSAWHKVHDHRALYYDIVVTNNNQLDMQIRFLDASLGFGEKKSKLGVSCSGDDCNTTVGGLQGSGAKTALWNLLGNSEVPEKKQDKNGNMVPNSEYYPDTFIDKMIFSFNGSAETIEHKMVHGQSWMVKATDLISKYFNLPWYQALSIGFQPNSFLLTMTSDITLVPYDGYAFEDSCVDVYRITFSEMKS